jgi:AcrR family transcriptional regulator
MTTTEQAAQGRRSERSRRAVIDAAAKLLTQRGYTAITMEGIAAEAKVGKATVYRWWPSKASIFMDLYAELAEEITPPADTGSVVKDVTLLIRGAFKLYRETAAGLALAGIIAEAQSNAAVSRIVRNDFAPSRRHIILHLLERGVARGEISTDADLELISEVLAGASWYCILVGSGQLTDRHATRIVETVLAGIVQRPAKNQAKKSARKRVSTAVAHV